MEIKKLIEMLDKGYKPKVRFNKKIDELDVESIFNENMITQFLSYRIEEEGTKDEYYVIDCSFKEFETYNLQFAISNYYDKNGIPCLNYKEAKQNSSTGVELLYVMASDNVCNIITDDSFDLYEEYIRYCENDKDSVSYISWLEREILNLRFVNEK